MRNHRGTRRATMAQHLEHHRGTKQPFQMRRAVRTMTSHSTVMRAALVLAPATTVRRSLGPRQPISRRNRQFRPTATSRPFASLPPLRGTQQLAARRALTARWFARRRRQHRPHGMRTGHPVRRRRRGTAPLPLVPLPVATVPHPHLSTRRHTPPTWMLRGTTTTNGKPGRTPPRRSRNRVCANWSPKSGAGRQKSCR